MKKSIFSFLAIMIGSYFFSQQILSDNFVSQCNERISGYTKQIVQDEGDNFPVIIHSNHARGEYPDNILFTGKVSINRGRSRLQADRVQLFQNMEDVSNPIRTIYANGNVYYEDDKFILKGSKGWVNLYTNDTTIWDGDYQMIDRQGYGKADIMIKRGQSHRYFILKNGSFTSCLSGHNAWSITGSKVIYDYEEKIIKIWNARFRLRSIPIFYSPYLYLPIGDRCRSGFLIPNFKYSKLNQLELHIPYYWNTASNMDFTITPHYLYKHRNIVWENEFRYLIHSGTGSVEFNYCPLNRNYEEPSIVNHHRHNWLFFWKHSGSIDRAWHFNINHTKINNPSYFRYFDLKYSSNNDGYFPQTFCLCYSAQNFNASLSNRKFQVLKRGLINRYSVEPQLDFNWNPNDLGPFHFQCYGQMVRFVNTALDVPKSTRLHLEPSINSLWFNSFMNINTEFKLMATHFHQKNFNEYSKQYFSNSKNLSNRILPLFKIDGKIVLKNNLISIENGIQIFEPRIQYLYVPYKNQRKIYNYDSSYLQFNYSNLFYGRTCTGLDRIASANRIATGITSRSYNQQNVEHFNISIGQIYYFTKSCTGDNFFDYKKRSKNGSLVWVGDTYWNITSRLRLYGNVQYNKILDNTVTGSGTLECRRNENCLVQLNYNHVRSECMQTFFYKNSNQNPSREVISQLGAKARWLLNDRLSVIGSYYYDTYKNKSTESMFGLQYGSCCYSIRIGCERKINSYDMISNQRRYNNIISLNIELSGLNSKIDLINQNRSNSSIFSS